MTDATGFGRGRRLCRPSGRRRRRTTLRGRRSPPASLIKGGQQIRQIYVLCVHQIRQHERSPPCGQASPAVMFGSLLGGDLRVVRQGAAATKHQLASPEVDEGRARVLHDDLPRAEQG